MVYYIAHYGVGHLQGGNSGRYKWGTGEKWNKKRLSSGDSSKTTNKTSARGKTSESTNKTSTGGKSSKSTNQSDQSAERIKKSANAGVDMYKQGIMTLTDALNVNDKRNTYKFINTTLKEIPDAELKKIVTRLALENNYMDQKRKQSQYKVNIRDILKLADDATSLVKSAKKWKSITFS